MSIQELGSMGEFVGALAVLVTLVYLSIQTRLTRKAAEETANFASSQATYAAVQAYDQWRSSILEHPELARIMVKARGTGVPPEDWTRNMLGFPPSEENQDEEG